MLLKPVLFTILDNLPATCSPRSDNQDSKPETPAITEARSETYENYWLVRFSRHERQLRLRNTWLLSLKMCRHVWMELTSVLRTKFWALESRITYSTHFPRWIHTLSNRGGEWSFEILASIPHWNLRWIVHFQIRHDRWIKALTTHLYRGSLDLKQIFISTGGN